MGGDFGPEFGGLLGDGTGDGAALGFTLVVDDDSSVVLTVDEGSVGSVPGSALTDDDSGVDFLSELLDSLFAGAEDDVSDGASRQSVEMPPDALACDDVKALGS